MFGCGKEDTKAVGGAVIISTVVCISALELQMGHAESIQDRMYSFGVEWVF